MPEIKRWSGNDTTDISIGNNGYKEIVYFARKFSKVFVFGDGHIGKAIQKYLADSDISIDEVFTSKTLSQVKEKFEDNCGIVIGVGDALIDEIMPCVSALFEEKQIFLPDSVIRESLGSILDINNWENEFWLNIYVTNKCNLGCKSCSAFAPICKPDFYELEKFKDDIKRISDMKFKKINELKFTGAEAMLHPNIIEMLEYTRIIFPDIKVQIYTNGLFIKSCSLDKLKKLSELQIILVVTEYPLPNLDLSDAYHKLDECGVLYYVIYADEQKYFSKRPLRFEGDVPVERYIECPRYKMCKSLFLFRGKLFKCIYAISAGYVNEAFDKSLKVNEADYVDIYKSDVTQVFEYATSRLPFCNYCSPIEEKIPWGISERKLEEWA